MSRATWTQDDREAWEERVAILTADGIPEGQAQTWATIYVDRDRAARAAGAPHVGELQSTTGGTNR